MSSSKRELPEGDEPELEPKAKKAKVDDATLDASGPSLQKQRVVLNPADCNLGMLF